MSGRSPFTDRTLVHEGLWRLRSMLPEARKIAETLVVSEVSPLMMAQAPYCYESNFLSLVIWPGERGGWVADLLLKDVPTGVSNVMGTSVERPFETQYEAIAASKVVLAFAIASHRLSQADPERLDGRPTFWLHEVAVALEPDLLAKATTLRGDTVPIAQDVRQALGRTLTRLGVADRCTLEDYKRLRNSSDGWLLAAALYTAASGGQLVWPPRNAASPLQQDASQAS